MSEFEPSLLSSLARIENKIDALAVAVADLSSRVTALETSEKHRSTDIDRRFGELQTQITAAVAATAAVAKDLDTTDKQVTEAKGGITVLRWVLGAIGVGGLGAGAMVADGAEGADGDHGADVVRAVIEAADRP